MKLFLIKFKAGILLQNLYWVGSLILSVVIVSSVAVGTYSTFRVNEEEKYFEIPMAVQVLEEANYRDGVEEYAFPGVELSIVNEVMSDSAASQVEGEGLEERIALVEEQLQQPVPLATNPPENNEGEIVNLIPTPTDSNNLPQPTNTLMISPTITKTNTRSATAANTIALELTATNTLIPVTGTSTKTSRT